MIRLALGSFLSCLAVAALAQPTPPPAVVAPAPGAVSAPTVGALAPDWTLTDIRTGESLTLSSLRGKYVLLDFWATWCGPCVHAMQHELNPLHQMLGSRTDWQLVSIGTPWNGDTAEAQREFADTNSYNWTFVYDADGSATTAYNVEGIPTLVMINPEGVIEALDHHGVGLTLAQRLDPTITSLAPRRADIATGAQPFPATGPAQGNVVSNGEVVFAFTPPADAAYAIQTAGTGFDTMLEVYDASGGMLGDNDDMGNGSLDSLLTLPLTAGQPVYILVKGYGATAGQFTLTVTAVP